MLSLTTCLAPLVLAGLLGWTGAVKAFSRGTAQQAPKTVLARMLRSSERATVVLRATGGAELLIAAGLSAAPGSPLPGTATAVLGAGFLGYLGYGRAVAPESSCGCSAREDAPITWRAFARAAVVLIGGATVAVAQDPWWPTLSGRPVGALAFLAGAAAVLVALSADLDRWWLLPLRRTRLRVFGHPLLGTAAWGPGAGRGERRTPGTLPGLAGRRTGGAVRPAGPLGGERVAHPPVLGCVRGPGERAPGRGGVRTRRHGRPRHR